MPTDLASDGEYCGRGEHDFERVGSRAWSTGRVELDRRFETVEYHCRDCPSKRWSKEEKQGQLVEWGAA